MKHVHEDVVPVQQTSTAAFALAHFIEDKVLDS